MKPRLAPCLVGAAAAALLACPGPALAQQYQATGNVNTIATRVFPGPVESLQNVDNFGFTDNPQANGNNVLEKTASVGGGGTAIARFVGTVGTLKAYAMASYGYGWDAQGHRILDGYTGASAQGTFYDTVTVSGGGLAVGSPVNYRVDFRIDGTLTSPRFEIGGALSADAVGQVRLRDNTSGQDVFIQWDASRQGTGVYSLTLATEVGHTLGIGGMLYAGAYVSANATLARAAEADFSHSAYYYLTPSVAGLNTLGASGHDFMAPVPEPAGWLMWALGAAALWRVRRVRAAP